MEINYYNRKWSQDPVCTLLLDEHEGLRLIIHIDPSCLSSRDAGFLCQVLVLAREDMYSVECCGGCIAKAQKRYFPFPDSGTDTTVIREFVETAVAA